MNELRLDLIRLLHSPNLIAREATGQGEHQNHTIQSSMLSGLVGGRLWFRVAPQQTLEGGGCPYL